MEQYITDEQDRNMSYILANKILKWNFLKLLFNKHKKLVLVRPLPFFNAIMIHFTKCSPHITKC